MKTPDIKLNEDKQPTKDDKKKILDIARKAERKMKKNTILHHAVDDLKTFVRMIYAWITGSYRETPWKAIILISTTLLYYVNPFDLLPDFIPFAGYVDDVTFILATSNALRSQIKAFHSWEVANKNAKPEEIIIEKI